MAKSRLFFWLFGPSLLMVGCHAARPAAECVLLDSDFEQFDGWIQPLPAFLNTEQAHTGHYSLRLAEGAEYSPSYHALLDRCSFIPRHLYLSAWVYAPSGRMRSTKLVTEINCHGRRPNVWVPFELEEVVKRYQKWEFVHRTIHLPIDLEATDELKVYVWHPETGGERIWLDDIKLTGEE